MGLTKLEQLDLVPLKHSLVPCGDCGHGMCHEHGNMRERTCTHMCWPASVISVSRTGRLAADIVRERWGMLAQGFSPSWKGRPGVGGWGGKGPFTTVRVYGDLFTSQRMRKQDLEQGRLSKPSSGDLLQAGRF